MKTISNKTIGKNVVTYTEFNSKEEIIYNSEKKNRFCILASRTCMLIRSGKERYAKNDIDLLWKRNLGYPNYGFINIEGPEINCDFAAIFTHFIKKELENEGWRQGRSSEKAIINESYTQNRSLLEHILKQLIGKQPDKEIQKYDLPPEFIDIVIEVWSCLHILGCVHEVFPQAYKNLLIAKYSPWLRLDENQSKIVDEIAANTNHNHIILGGAGTGKTLVMLRAAAKVDKGLSDQKDNSGRVAIVLQGNFADEGKSIIEKYASQNTKVYTLHEFTNEIARLIYAPNENDYFSTIFIDEAQNLPSFVKGKIGKTNFGFQSAWTARHKLTDPYSQDKVFSLKKYFDRSLTGRFLYTGEDLSDYLDLLNYLKSIHKIRNVVICFDPHQWVYSGSIGRDPAFKFTQSNAVHYSHKNKDVFDVHHLSHQYRISKHSYFHSDGDDYVKGIKYFLRLSEDSVFNKRIFNEYVNHSSSSKEDYQPYFGIVNSIADLFEYVNEMKNQHPGSHNRVIAGYAVSRTDNKDGSDKVWFDFDDTGKRIEPGWAWNDKQEGFVFDEKMEDIHRQQVASIFAVQGQDLNYVGVIIANDLQFRDGKITSVPENYRHTTGKLPASLKENTEYYQKKFDEQICGIYYVLLTRAIDGIRVYFQDKELEKYFRRIMRM